ncbi:DUF302 domain-containing protein [Planomonospora sp. ID67723]|uniref:DUF302 domain-containing protein n=1 Tax=Planomonospora sp. ID67723 TaxID=2738134 RepID=UPI0018C3D883|nr:DUF302 domain-containing protein [Planomonospora sp. ID67723]MBG0831847.1 DUF302 domain-containing protein [Planomonospora sp. ID67723]
MGYAHTITVTAPFDEAVAATRQDLAEHGFGIVSEIDIRAAFAGRLGPEAAATGDYLILGACNPQLAHQALGGEAELGLLLPCNVVVRRAPGADATTVQAVDARIMGTLTGAPQVAEVASDADADARLRGPCGPSPCRRPDPARRSRPA